MNRIKIGVMGCANIAKRSMIPAILSIPEFELIGVASRSIDKAKSYAKQFGCEAIQGYQTMVDRKDIIAIYMPLPTGLHDEWVNKALAAGKHVHVEKSLAVSEESAKAMVSRAQESGRVLMENFMFLYHSQHKFVKKIIDDGEIGEIRAFRSAFGFPPLKKDNFRYSKILGGGALLDAAAYTVMASQFFLGPRLKVAAASLFEDEGGEVDIYGGAYLQAPKSLFAEIAFGFDNFYQCQYEIWGSRGKITAERAFTAGPDFRPTVLLEQQDRRTRYTLDADNHFVNILNEFKECILSHDVNRHSDELLNQSRLLQEIRKKSEKNRLFQGELWNSKDKGK